MKYEDRWVFKKQIHFHMSIIKNYIFYNYSKHNTTQMIKFNSIFRFALTLMMAVVPCIAQGTAPGGVPMTAFLPTNPGYLKTAEPVARVFGDRLYVYTAMDHGTECGPKSPTKREGSGKFCMIGYQAFSTNDAQLEKNWVSHGYILLEESVPWALKPAGFKSSGRMFAADVVKGDKLYHLFFSAPKEENKGNVIGVATSTNPEGPFTPDKQPIEGTSGNDPTVIKLKSGQWVLFTTSNGVVNVQNLNGDFTQAGEKSAVTGLLKGRDNIKKAGLSSEYRNGRLYLYYAASYEGGYKIRQAVAKNPNNPKQGFYDIRTVINAFDKHGRNNKASMVTFKEKSYAFYHQHVADPRERWIKRRVAYSHLNFWCDGKAQPITPPVLSK